MSALVMFAAGLACGASAAGWLALHYLPRIEDAAERRTVYVIDQMTRHYRRLGLTVDGFIHRDDW